MPHRNKHPSPPHSTVPATSASQRALWLRTVHLWHWISSALCLVGLLLFTLTGFTLNHASQISATPDTRNLKTTLPVRMLEQLKADVAQMGDRAALPPAARAFFADTWSLRVGSREAEWSADEIYLSLPEPGGDGWLAIDLGTGHVEYEHTDRGWIAYFNDLHKGRNTGPAWRWFIDVFALACLVFSITGLWLLYLHARHRRLTWPMVGVGALLPLLILLLLTH
jgi:hypothetical protein